MSNLTSKIYVCVCLVTSAGHVTRSRMRDLTRRTLPNRVVQPRSNLKRFGDRGDLDWVYSAVRPDRSPASEADIVKILAKDNCDDSS